MTTGAMTGADAPALRALAAQMSQSAARLDGIRQGIRSRVYSIHWDGPDGANFRRAWDGQHVPMLASVAQGLRHSAERLLAEATQQETASGAGGAGGVGGVAGVGGGQTIGPSTGPIDPPYEDTWLADLERLVKNSGLVLGGASTFFELLVKGYGEKVSGYLRANGTWVEGYMRWTAGHADTLNRLGSPAEVLRHADELSRVGKVLPYLGAAFDGYGQWREDEGAGYSTGEHLARAAGGSVASFAADAGAEWAMTGAGAAIGTAICPGVGTVVGGLIGFGAAAWTTNHFGDEITDVGAAIGSAVWDGGSAVVDFGGDALEAGGELLGDIGDGAAELWEEWTPW